MENFAQLLSAEIPSLRRYARALARDIELADDFVQNCLTRAIVKQHLWQPNSDLHAWLFTILHNEHVNYVRRSARSPNTVPIDTATPLGSVKPAALDVLELRDLSTAIGKLRYEEREALLLIGLEGICYNEAALILGIPVGTVRSRLSRGRDQLRTLMGIKETPWRVRAVARQADTKPETERMSVIEPDRTAAQQTHPL